ncbi:MAG TPA: hypothetical protein VHM65_11040, partial [Candidatus Lustribacter sp.]|nr:hypothetical protein [Candidatus Lustribacter sp.]
MSQPMATARAFPRSWPEGAPRRALAPLRVVPAAIRRQGHGGFALLCIGLLTTGLLGLLLLNTTLGQGAFTMQDLRVRSTGLAGQEEALTQAIDQNRSPAALASRASAMGMV